MKTVVIAGGFDPIHSGHLDHIRKAKALGGKLTVITHADEILIKKKGYCFMPLFDRKEILESLRYVDEVVISIDNDGTVSKTLEKIKQSTEGELIFVKGGDRVPQNMPQNEIETCERLGIPIFYGVGDKLASSQDLVTKASIQLNNKGGQS